MKLFLTVMYVFGIISMSVSVCWLFMRANRNRQTYCFVICQILIIIWSASQLIRLEATSLIQLFRAYCTGNFAICFIGGVWLIFSKFYLGEKINKAVTVAVIMVSVFNYAAFLTNNFHHMYYSHFSTEEVKTNFIFYENIIYTYICMILGIINILRRLRREKNKRIGQTVLVICAVMLPLAANAIYLGGNRIIKFDITPLTFGFSSIMILFAIYKYGFLNVNAMAYEKIFESISERVFIFNAKGRITYSNNASESLSAEVNSIKDIELNEELANRSDSFCETDVIDECRRLHIKRYNYFANDGILMSSVFIISDITRYYELIERNEELSVAKEKLAVERERNRIAQEVHDTAGHTLTMLNSLSKLAGAELAGGRTVKAAEYIDESVKIASEGITQLRMSVNNLKQGKYCCNVTSGIRELISEIKEKEVELCIQGSDGIKYSDCSSVLYQCCREAITNCLRYSEADRIDIILKFLENSVELYIIDNGKGCEKISYGNGLNGISERTAKAGGKAVFSSSIGNGFSVSIKIPTGENIL